MKYICHSGGCPGADMAWETEGNRYGIETISYSFRNHVQEGKNPKILTVDELAEGWLHVCLADKTLQKKVDELTSPYVKNLLCRNWFQVKNSEAVFAIGSFDGGFDKVKGGTGWAVQMAIDNHKPIYFYDQKCCVWTFFDYTQHHFIPTSIPKLTIQFAGIGTRELDINGRNAIQLVLTKTFLT